ncbi:MAG: hypothetical protein BWY12_00521 [candidate division BRC1 bacterium ADurb.Bin183]|nr:MAG: hypothetical protein BWY12_00521 [candidate division BRC1 bacterium ADurb.Bin183]
MYQRILFQIRDCVRVRRYIMTLHAEEEMDEDGFSIFDVEHCLLTAQIEERQKDMQTGEWKYRLSGKSLNDENMELVVKFGHGGILVIITVYLA